MSKCGRSGYEISFTPEVHGEFGDGPRDQKRMDGKEDREVLELEERYVTGIDSALCISSTTC